MEDFKRPCSHKSKKFNCEAVCRKAIIQAREKLYAIKNRLTQNNKLAHLLRVSCPNKIKSYKKVQSVRVKYMFPDKDKKLQYVCQKFFCAAFAVSQRRLLTISKFIQSGDAIIEKRGGDHRSQKYAIKHKAVVDFIGNFKGMESHYNRRKSVRIYLPSELNVTKLYKMYNSSVDTELKVKKTFFAQIFAKNFNIGFGTPATDVCSFCYQMKNQIKLAKTEQEKHRAMTKRRIHKISAKQFHLLMNNEPEQCVSFCFDLQQVQILPKIPIQEAFYATQLALYNFCVTDLQTKHPVFYTWMETQAGRGSIEIGSSLYDFFLKVDWPDDSKLLRLFCDGCSGQNKNSIIISMLMYWLYHKAPENLKTVVIIFPVRGHSFLPADRVFGRIEKISRKKAEILKKEDYWNIFSEVGAVRCLGYDWKLYDLKLLGDSLKKVEGIRDAKRIYLDKVSTKKCTIKIRVEEFYRNDTSEVKSLLKAGKSLQNLKLQEVVLGRTVKSKKLKDIDNLLDKAYSKIGENNVKINWRKVEDLKWYKHLIDHENTDDINNISFEEQECDCNEEDDRLRI